MDINGVWKGEYIRLAFDYQTGNETPVPFILKIQSVKHGQLIPINVGIFEGICQDDPDVTRFHHHATIVGRFTGETISFTKQYPVLMTEGFPDIITYDTQPHPEILYEGKLNVEEFSGTWSTQRAFRKFNNTVFEIESMKGLWWMKKI